VVLKTISFLFIGAGGVLMIMAVNEYQKLLDYYRQESYRILRAGYRINLVLLYLFVGGFAIALVDSILREPDVLYTILAVIFQLGALYVLFAVKTQAQAALMLREKAMEVTRAFVDAIDLKDFCTRAHSRHVYDIVRLFYDQLKEFKHVLNRGKLLDAALLHDIGMLRLPKDILAKRGGLSQEEVTLMRTHPLHTYRIISKELNYPDEVGFVALQHHERWDGQGYPAGISGENIDIGARILSVADAFEAMVSKKPYRNSMVGYEAMKALMSDNQSRFDPDVLKAFIAIMGIYPIGSIVILNDAAVARVTEILPGAPLRPKVRILIDKFGQKQQNGEMLNLLTDKTHFISRAFNPKEPVNKHA
jgi:HD-GYP domain-containing protein (c-di-GMP phosphodiesterase class II)